MCVFFVLCFRVRLKYLIFFYAPHENGRGRILWLYNADEGRKNFSNIGSRSFYLCSTFRVTYIFFNYYLENLERLRKFKIKTKTFLNKK